MRREPTAAEIAKELEMDLDEVSETLKMSNRHVSMDAPFSQGEENSLLDVLASDENPLPDTSLMSASLRSEIERALSTLTEREAEVIKLYFGFDGEHAFTLEEIGEQFHLDTRKGKTNKGKSD